MNLAAAEALIGNGLTESPLSVAIFDAELRIVWANEASQSCSSGLPPRDWRGRRLAEVMPDIDAGVIEQSMRRVLATGESVLDLLVAGRVPHGAGSRTARGTGNRGGAGSRGVRRVRVGERYWSCYLFPVGPPGTDSVKVIQLMRDVTERALSQRRLALSDQASAQIGRTLDTTRTAEELLDVLVPDLADVGAVDLLATVIDGDLLARRARYDGQRLQRVAIRWPGRSPAPREYARLASIETSPASLHHRRLIAGLPLFVPSFGEMSVEQVRQMDVGSGQERLLIAHRAGAHSLMVVPLVARGVIMGLVVMYRLRGSRPFTGADLLLADAVVSRAALSMDNARLYTRERASALVL
jgi:hypothetical protein